ELWMKGPFVLGSELDRGRYRRASHSLNSPACFVRLNHVACFMVNANLQRLCRRIQNADMTRTIWQDYLRAFEKSLLAIVGCALICFLLFTYSGVGLLLSWALLPIPLSRPLLSVSLQPPLLSSPGLGCPCLRSPRLLPLLLRLHRFLNSPLYSCASITLPAASY